MQISTNYSITQDELKGKVILVTGANRGFWQSDDPRFSQSRCDCNYAWT